MISEFRRTLRARRSRIADVFTPVVVCESCHRGFSARFHCSLTRLADLVRTGERSRYTTSSFHTPQDYDGVTGKIVATRDRHDAADALTSPTILFRRGDRDVSVFP